MEIDTLAVGAFESNCYVLTGSGNKALVIDPGGDAERIVALLRERGLAVAAYLLTHGHVDHVSALAGCLEAFPAPVGMHPADLRWAFSPRNQMPPFFPAPRPPARIEREYQDAQEWTDAGLAYRIVATPGHTPGGICFHFVDQTALFTGDTLFAGSVGRTDLPGGSSRLLADSLKKLAGLPPETRIYPGHGPDSTIGDEQHTNYYMRHPPE